MNKKIKKNRIKKTKRIKKQKNKRIKKQKTKRIKKQKTKKVKQLSKSKSKSKLSKTKIKIIDVPFSRKENKGTKASKNIINYHYQHLNNISEFLYKLFLKKQIKNINFFDDLNDCILQLDINNKKIFPYYINLNKYKELLNKSLKKKGRFISISMNSELPQGSSEIENHANILLIDKFKKQIEFFEPHGYKPKMSTYSQSVQKYHKKLKLIKYFFKELLPEYNIINVVDYVKDNSVYSDKDAKLIDKSIAVAEELIGIKRYDEENNEAADFVVNEIKNRFKS